MTAKDFRTWHGTAKAAAELATTGPQPTRRARKKAVAAVCSLAGASTAAMNRPACPNRTSRNGNAPAGRRGSRCLALVEAGAEPVAVHLHQVQAVGAGVDRQHRHDDHVQPCPADQ